MSRVFTGVGYSMPIIKTKFNTVYHMICLLCAEILFPHGSFDVRGLWLRKEPTILKLVKSVHS